MAPFLWKIYVLNLGPSLPVPVYRQLFADDIKIYIGIGDGSESALLQDAVDQVESWSFEKRMSLSKKKRLVIKSQPCSTVYGIQGSALPVHDDALDLGVWMSPHLKFHHHVTAVVAPASKSCNMILRTFIVKRASFYLHMYRTIVLPKLLYCCTVWSPYLQRDIKLLEAVA